MSVLEAIAHSKGKDGTRQTLQEHLHNVAELAAGYAAAWGRQDAATFLGLTHDLGKLKATWQERIMSLEAWDEGGRKPADKRKFIEMLHDHKMAGAGYVYEKYHDAPTALLIAGHHGGIPDFDKFIAEMVSGKWEPARQEVAERVETLQIPKRERLASSGDYFSLMMLYSALVDADAWILPRTTEADSRHSSTRWLRCSRSCWSCKWTVMPATKSRRCGGKCASPEYPNMRLSDSLTAKACTRPRA